MSLYVDVEKDFGGFKLCTEFETEDKVLGILGASGCGKSMTLRCIAGIVKPDRGRIVLDDTVLFDSEKNINLPPQKRHVGLLFQNYALFPNMTVWQNLMTGIKPYEKDKKKASDAIETMIQKFYLTGLEKHRPSQLSGGQQQRVALARILLSRPNLLMLDEPFSALDGYLRWQLELELKDILEEFGGSTLFVSHSRDEVYRICDEVCVMDDGNSSPVIPVKTLFEQPQTLAAALLSGCKNYSRARNAGGGQVEALDWGVLLHCNEEILEEVSHIGVRSHFICLSNETEGINTIPCRILRIVEDVFSMVILVRPVTAPDDDKKDVSDQNNSQIRLEMGKDVWRNYCKNGCKNPGDDIRIFIAPENILLLR